MPAAAEPPKRGRGRPSAGAREAILAAALEVISTDGLGRLTTREVARRAGVSEASVFYHYRDKVGLLQEVMLAGLEPLKGLDAATLAGQAGQSLEETLRQIARALEEFLDSVLPVVESVHSDPALRSEFATRMTERDLGPHRGVQLIAAYLGEMARLGAVRPDANLLAAAQLLFGACFLRSWLRHLSGGENPALASLDDTTRAMARLLSPPGAETS